MFKLFHFLGCTRFLYCVMNQKLRVSLCIKSRLYLKVLKKLSRFEPLRELKFGVCSSLSSLLKRSRCRRKNTRISPIRLNNCLAFILWNISIFLVKWTPSNSIAQHCNDCWKKSRIFAILKHCAGFFLPFYRIYYELLLGLN